jgi:hypothetical protein
MGSERKLAAADLLSLERYARERDEFRRRAIAHRRARRLKLGEHCTLSFEDRLTIQYQIQEMLRAERIFEAVGIAEELEAYNPLIPDGNNLKATMMIEYPERDERVQRLAQLRGIERECWLRVAGHDAVRAVADEDLERETEEKTSAVHFVRFEFSHAMIAALRAGAALAAGIDHPVYAPRLDDVGAELRAELLRDFD